MAVGAGFIVFGIVFALAAAPRGSVWGLDLTSDSFQIRDPVFQLQGGDEMTSTNFRLRGSVGQIGIGTSTAATFRLSAGNLAFPVATRPVAAVVAGNGEIGLYWMPSSATGGWTIGGYSVGQATVSGGPYTYASVGSTTVAVRGNLTNGTTYYFVVRAEDAFSYAIATSSEVSASPAANRYGVRMGEFTTQASTTPFVSSNGTRVDLDFPANALSSGHAFQLSAYSISEDAAVSDTPLPSGKSAANSFYSFSFTKMNDASAIASFDQAVTLTWDYTDADVSGMDERTLAIYRWTGSSWSALSGSSINASQNRVTGSTQSFSTFALIGEPSAAAPATVPPAAAAGGGGGVLFPGRIVFPTDVLRLFLPEGIPRCAPGVAAADLDCDGRVGLRDFSIFLFRYAAAPMEQEPGAVDVRRFSIFLSRWSEGLLAFAPQPVAGPGIETDRTVAPVPPGTSRSGGIPVAGSPIAQAPGREAAVAAVGNAPIRGTAAFSLAAGLALAYILWRKRWG